VRPGRRTIWIDVEDLFQHFAHNPRLSGIQRLVFEILRVLPDRAKLNAEGARIAFVRHVDDESLLDEVSFAEIAVLFDAEQAAVAKLPAVVAKTKPATPRSPTIPVHRKLRRWLVGEIMKLPPVLSVPMLRAGVLQLDAFRQLGALAVLAFPSFAVAATTIEIEPNESEAANPLLVFSRRAEFAGKPGDVFLILGAPWVHPDYGSLLRQVRERYQFQPALLMYDLIPLRRPEWCASDLVRDFRTWLDATLPQCPRLMAISKATAADVEAYAAETRLSLAGPVMPIPIGTGFGVALHRDSEPLAAPGLPEPGTYALFVSTLEARKNHALLFRVWRRLLLDMPRAEVPTLVFAGRVGWLVADLMQQLENTNWLDGKIRLIRDPTDAELLTLYRGCQFTLFPSLFEGWGLPVSESLALGRPCVSSNRTSLPEAGGSLARYFDPENFDEVCQVVRGVIEDPAGLGVWRERVQREFRHVPWDETADAILEFCREAEVTLPRPEADPTLPHPEAGVALPDTEAGVALSRAELSRTGT
jgi:glycosyltransferase involved in cell wall biosynthesis